MYKSLVPLNIAFTIPIVNVNANEVQAHCVSYYMSSLMGKSRLSSLALLRIHYDTTGDLYVVVDAYARLHPRRRQLENLL